MAIYINTSESVLVLGVLEEGEGRAALVEWIDRGERVPC